MIVNTYLRPIETSGTSLCRQQSQSIQILRMYCQQASGYNDKNDSSFHLFYDIANLQIGYQYSKEVDFNQIDHSQFITLVRKLSHQFRIQMDRLRESEAQMSQQFKKQVTKSVKNRQLYTEKHIMEQIVYKRDLQIIYRILISECQKILTNSHSLSLLIKRKTDIHSQNTRKIAIKTPIQVVLFANDLVTGGSISQKNNDLERMSDLVRIRYTEVTAIQVAMY